MDIWARVTLRDRFGREPTLQEVRRAIIARKEQKKADAAARIPTTRNAADAEKIRKAYEDGDEVCLTISPRHLLIRPLRLHRRWACGIWSVSASTSSSWSPFKRTRRRWRGEGKLPRHGARVWIRPVDELCSDCSSWGKCSGRTRCNVHSLMLLE